MSYNIENLDYKGDRHVKCLCGSTIFNTPEPPTDKYYSGRFWCVVCGARWNTDNIVQRLAFVKID